MLRPRPEIILLGDEEGTASICQDLQVRYIPTITRNEFGTPLVGGLFDTAARAATGDLLCYVNADIILMSDFMEAAQKVRRWRQPFLMVGRRADLSLTAPWDFAALDWETRLREHARRESRLRGPFGVDYFCFRRGLYPDTFPSLALGRGRWEGWFIYRARAAGCPVVDVSRTTVVIHQNHDYSHLAYALPDAESWRHDVFWARGASQLEEFKINTEACDSAAPVRFGLFDATHVLTSRGVRRALGRKYLARHFETLPALHPAWTPLVAAVSTFARTSRPIRRAVSRYLHL